MGHTALPRKAFHIGVTGAVQRKVADKTQCIGQRSSAVILVLHDAPRPVKKDPPRLLVHGVAQCTHRVGLGSMIIKQQVRPVQADIVKLTVLFQLSTQFIRQMFQHIGAKAAVCIS